MGMSRRRGLANSPIVAVVGFNLFTLVVFVTAPVSWDTRHLTELCLLVLFCQLLLPVGFLLGRRASPPRPLHPLPLSSGDSAMSYLFAFYGLSFLVGYAFRMGFSPLDVDGMFRLLVAGLRDRHLGYEMALRGTGLGPVPWSVYFVVSIVNQCFFAAGFLHWKRMTFPAKLLFSGFVGLELLFSVGRGTAFGVVSMVTTFLLASLVWMKTRLGTIALLGVLFLGSVAFFSYNLVSRSAGVERVPDLTEFGRSAVVAHHPVWELTPERLRPSYLNVLSYLGGGYYHASLALDLDFRSTLFLGNNPALVGLAEQFGLDVWSDTYMHRLQAAKGVDEYGLWHSAYTWYACDVSFWGVPLLLLGLAWLFGFSWERSVQGDFLSGIVFVMLGNMLLFLFANNTYLSSVFYSFMFVLPLWVSTRLLGFPLATAGTHAGQGQGAVAAPRSDRRGSA